MNPTQLRWHGSEPVERSRILQWLLQRTEATGLNVTALWLTVIWLTCSVDRPTMWACLAKISPVPVRRARGLTCEQVLNLGGPNINMCCNFLYIVMTVWLCQQKNCHAMEMDLMLILHVHYITGSESLSNLDFFYTVLYLCSLPQAIIRDLAFIWRPAFVSNTVHCINLTNCFSWPLPSLSPPQPPVHPRT